MPPLKAINKKSNGTLVSEPVAVVKTMTTRSSKGLISASLKKENIKDFGVFPKRKAVSPIKGIKLKRSALGNITNAIETKCVISGNKKPAKKIASSNITKPTIASTAKLTQTTALPKISKSKSSPKPVQVKPSLPPPVTSRLKPLGPPVSTSKPNVPSKLEKSAVPVATIKPPAVKSPKNKYTVTSKPRFMVSNVYNTRRSSGRRSTLDSSAGSLYVSALSDVLDEEVSSNENVVEEALPLPKINIDEEYAHDPFQCANYAFEIFEYLKSREEHFRISDYMAFQPTLSPSMRAILIDWMVEIQESFELNHETLYLGVKLMDKYLSKVKVSKTMVQLVGATAMLISAKYDEQIPPSVEDFLYICNEAYDLPDIKKMEFHILKHVDFELGFPISYRFLRRYARCVKAPMPLLTLARYILEMALMDYSIISLSDSKLAAAALYLAFKMKNEQEWDDTLVYFSGYKVKDFIDVVYILNDILHQRPRQSLSTVRNKYSHKIFHEVAMTPLVDNEDL